MTAVVAEAAESRPAAPGSGRDLELWRDLARTVDRAGGDPDRLWVDDSKAILRGGKGRDRLEAACLAAVHAAGKVLPGSLAELLEMIGEGPPTDAELSPWFEGDNAAGRWPWTASRRAVEGLLAREPLAHPAGEWRLAAIHAVVVGPSRFNAELAALGSKSQVHFWAFARLLRRAWDRAADGVVTAVTSD